MVEASAVVSCWGQGHASVGQPYGWRLRVPGGAGEPDHGRAGHGGRGARADQQVGFAGAGIPDQTQRAALGDPAAGRERVDDGRVDVGVGAVVEVAQGLLTGKRAGPDAAFGPATAAVLHSAISSSARDPASDSASGAV